MATGAYGTETYTPDGYYSNNTGDAYQIDPVTGKPIQVASGFDNSGSQAQQDVQAQQAAPAQSVAMPSSSGGSGSTGASVGSGVGTAVGAGIGAAVGGPAGAMVGGAIGGGVGSAGGSILGGAEEGKSDTQRIQEDVMNKKLQTQRALYNNRGADEVIGSIAQPGGPMVDAARARLVKGEPLTPEEKKAIAMGGYTTASQGAAREGVIYDNELKRIQRQQTAGNLFRAAMVPIGLAVGVKLLRA